MIKHFFRNFFVLSHRSGEIIPFPKVNTNYKNNISQETLSTRRYICELLILKGYKVQQNIEISDYHFDIIIPNQNYLIYCSAKDPNDVTSKIHIKKLQRIAHSNGFKFYVVYKSYFYKDITGLLHRLKLNLH